MKGDSFEFNISICKYEETFILKHSETNLNAEGGFFGYSKYGTSLSYCIFLILIFKLFALISQIYLKIQNIGAHGFFVVGPTGAYSY